MLYFPCQESPLISAAIEQSCLSKFSQIQIQKFRSSELNDAPLEGSTIFLYRSSTGYTPLDSSRLAELKYAFFLAGREVTLKNYGA